MFPVLSLLFVFFAAVFLYSLVATALTGQFSNLDPDKWEKLIDSLLCCTNICWCDIFSQWNSAQYFQILALNKPVNIIGGVCVSSGIKADAATLAEKK